MPKCAECCIDSVPVQGNVCSRCSAKKAVFSDFGVTITLKKKRKHIRIDIKQGKRYIGYHEILRDDV